MVQDAPKNMGEAVLLLVRQVLQSDKSHWSEGIVIYTSYGIVRGRVSRSFLQWEAKDGAQADSLHLPGTEVIEIEGATVEHYANHLAATHYDRLFLSSVDIRGFALSPVNSSGY